MHANTMVLWYHYSRHAIDGFKGHRNGSTMLNHLPKKVFLSCVYVLKLNLKLNPAICHQVKMLRVLEKARPKCAIEISSTFCGAHSVPKGSSAAQVCSHHVYFYYKVNRCLARYSLRATTTNRPTNRATNEPAMVRNANFGLNLVVFEQKKLL